MSEPTFDVRMMQRALELAGQALFLTSPNPRVGCVLTDAQSRVLGEGHTQAVGQAHAEVMALRDAQSRGHDLQGATAYVTLEPCAHQGRTGPCCEALTQAGVARVVVALADPNPLVAGRGLAHLRAHGVKVELGLLAEQAHDMNIGFMSRMTRGRPWVRMKIAASLDGQTALANGLSQWITGPEARADGHAWRARACAILTGMGTVREDDPRMDVRLVQTPRQPALVVVDSRWETPATAQLWAPRRPVWIYGAQQPNAAQQALIERGAEVRCMANAAGKVDLIAMMADLGQRGVNELHIEAGHLLNGSLLRAGLVDELLIYLAPQMLGNGRGMAQWPEFTDLSQALSFEWIECERMGRDLRLRARR
ncbi:MAG: bifunctional diaminohydroxyphosphoribosylaminopyrimidine deaminase/5-amino-6-(5-phosphoribosylamino)uracil reductase RibD [Alphaproteobacteria bacterium]|nr:bifunctional diaminohydroxyphosphoribosylaminopyrimidine deaminase/5-amino-6-(5-phosphoribosylamino)uracil reductase RibD [Alphaproteobacteria bacterium]